MQVLHGQVCLWGGGVKQPPTICRDTTLCFNKAAPGKTRAREKNQWHATTAAPLCGSVVGHDALLKGPREDQN